MPWVRVCVCEPAVAERGGVRAPRPGSAQVAADKLWGSKPIVTELKPLDVLYPAEGYHQNYYNDNPSQPYCQFVVAPKVCGDGGGTRGATAGRVI